MQFAKMMVILLAGLCLSTSCATPHQQQQLQTDDKRVGAQNFTYDGSFLGGRTFKTHQVIPNVSKSAAVERAVKCIVTSGGWTITSTDKELGIISASQQVSYGQGKTAPLSVGIDSVENGVEVSIAYSISGGVTSPVDAVRNFFCKIMAAIGDGPTGESPSESKLTVPSSAPANDDPTARLQKLKELKESGVLTEEEYQAKRKAIIEKL